MLDRQGHQDRQVHKASRDYVEVAIQGYQVNKVCLVLKARKAQQARQVQQAQQVPRERQGRLADLGRQANRDLQVLRERMLLAGQANVGIEDLQGTMGKMARMER